MAFDPMTCSRETGGRATARGEESYRRMVGQAARRFEILEKERRVVQGLQSKEEKIEQSDDEGV
ncbi:hypothetical protein HYALB_00011472 [Hymenoscyphus albidus]|uniref:Uncharacterized protein n=1 Tax=Hymenoscyphus albidus TaxID=595503 RepID=A0A9N9Q6C8_9HELO|nr:hypothetical protein HYALB_00011472 [Hymenoscyphus albidus]